MTGQFRLIHDTGNRLGFLFYVPVYRPEAHLGNVQERRENLVAWISAAFVTESFFDGIVGRLAEQIDLQVFDGEPSAENWSYGGMAGGHPHFARITRMHLYGRTLTLGWKRNLVIEGKLNRLPDQINRFYCWNNDLNWSPAGAPAAIRRAALFTASPITVYSRRLVLPTGPANTGPVATPAGSQAADATAAPWLDPKDLSPKVQTPARLPPRRFADACEL
jgi:hypothetical protein